MLSVLVFAFLRVVVVGEAVREVMLRCSADPVGLGGNTSRWESA